jgi:hypothetical protein
MAQVPRLLSANPSLAIITFHRYPLDRCYTKPGDPTYPTITNLLSPAATTGLAAQIVPFAALARTDGLQFRVDELNSVACSGEPGVSDTFASALWVLDTLFALARDGATGVNIHTFPTAAYRLFSFANAGGQWLGTVNPEYYGLLMFAQAAPAGAQLMRVVTNGDAELKAWATTTPGGDTDVVLIDDSASQPAVVTVRAASGTDVASLELLQAPSLAATTDVTIGGTSFAAPTPTGALASAPVTTSLAPTARTYTVELPAGSAALLTVPPSGASPY